MDSLEVQFLPMKKVIDDSSDFVLKIVYRNLTNRVVKVYSEYVNSPGSRKFTNLEVDQEVKKKGKYKNAYNGTACNFGIEDMPGYRHYDQPRKDLAPFDIDTVKVGLIRMIGGGTIEEGAYRYKFLLRVKTIWDTTQLKNVGEDIMVHSNDKFEYIESQWLRFKITHYIMRIYNPDGSLRVKVH